MSQLPKAKRSSMFKSISPQFSPPLSSSLKKTSRDIIPSQGQPLRKKIGFTEMCEQEQQFKINLAYHPQHQPKQQTQRQSSQYDTIANFDSEYFPAKLNVSQTQLSPPLGSSRLSTTVGEDSPRGDSSSPFFLNISDSIKSTQKAETDRIHRPHQIIHKTSLKQSLSPAQSERKFSQIHLPNSLKTSKTNPNLFHRSISIMSSNLIPSKTCQGIFFEQGTNNSIKSNISIAAKGKLSQMSNKNVKEKKKTPFSKGCTELRENLVQLSKQIGSKSQFFNNISKIMETKSAHLKQSILLPDQKEVQMDAAIIDRALVGAVASIQPRSSLMAQKILVQNLIRELQIVTKEIFEQSMNQSKLNIGLLAEQISYERDEVDILTARLTRKHFPNFQKKAELQCTFTFNSMPVTYATEKFSLAENKFGAFPFISVEGKHVSSEIGKAVCKLKEVPYQFVNPYPNIFS